MMTTHGTPQGYADGCRAGACLNHGTIRMTCTEAAIRYRGDYAYMTAVDNGTATDAKEVFVVPRPPRVVAETIAQAAARKPRAKPKKPRARKTVAHGTESGYKRFKCRNDCPETFTCRMAANLARKNQWAVVRGKAA